MSNNFLSTLDEIKHSLNNNGQRALVWITGSPNETYLCLTAALDQLGGNHGCVWVSRQFDQLETELRQQLGSCQVIAHASHLLGTQSQFLIYDAHPGFDPDLFCCAAGTLEAGGMLFLLSPRAEHWVSNQDKGYKSLLTYPHVLSEIPGRFIKRLVVALEQLPMVAKWDCMQNAWLQSIDSDLPDSGNNVASSAQGIHYSQEQQSVVARVKKVALGHRNRPLVVTADRGRGKSAALGYALAMLTTEILLHRGDQVDHTYRVAITAPFKDNVKVLLQHYEHGVAHRYSTGFSVNFYPPDELLSLNVQPDLVIVEEAAAIPEAILNSYLDKFRRLVFSTTIQGYEGTGRGFSVRFKPSLQQRCPNYSAIELVQPIRWGENDLLERAINDLFLLKDNLSEISDMTGPLPEFNTLSFEELSQDQLLADDNELAALFELLVQAHYRTRPSDLRALLDTLNFRVWVIKQGQRLLGCCWVAMEGKLDDDITALINQGKRRPQGHLLPQVLCQTLGYPELAHCSYARIVRIAILPEFQSHGLGSHLLCRTERVLQEEGVDFLGSSFSAFTNVVGFWHRNEYHPIHMGYSKEASSGAHALFVLKSTKDEFDDSIISLSRQFRQEFLFQLHHQFRYLDTGLIAAVLAMLGTSTIHGTGQELTEKDLRALSQFAAGGRTFEASMYRLHKVFVCFVLLNKLHVLLPSEQQIFIEILLKGHTIEQLRAMNLISGRKDAIAKLRSLASHMICDEQLLKLP